MIREGNYLEIYGTTLKNWGRMTTFHRSSDEDPPKISLVFKGMRYED